MNLRKLIRGKAIGAQPFFVETFNAMVDFINNLKGDKDVNNSTGSVNLDRSDATHPVIRGEKSGGADPDDISIEKTTGGKMQIKGWDTETPGLGMTLASLLVHNDEDSSADCPPSMAHVLVRDPNDGSLKFAMIDRLPSDGQSIDFEQDPQAATADKRLAIFGFSAAAVGQTPIKGANGLTWAFPINALNGVTLVTNVEWVGAPSYVIRVTKRTVRVLNGVLTLGQEIVSDIPTTPISQGAAS